MDVMGTNTFTRLSKV